MAKTNIPSRYNWIFENGDVGEMLIDNKKMLIRKYFFEGLRKILKIFKYTEIPKTISQRTIELMIFRGYARVFRKDGKWYVGYGAFSGVNNYDYIPVNAIVTNTYLKYSRDLIVANEENLKDINESNIEDYVFIIPNDELYQGLFDEVSEYAEMQTECILTLKSLLYNARIPFTAICNQESVKTSFDSMIKDVIDGKSSVGITGNYLFDALKLFPTSNSQHANDIKCVIECMQYLSAKFDNRIGLNANYNMKRESLNDDEISLNDDNLLPQIDEMFDCRKKAFDLINRASGEQLFNVELDSSWKIKKDEIKIEQEIKKSQIIDDSNQDESDDAPKEENPKEDEK